MTEISNNKSLIKNVRVAGPRQIYQISINELSRGMGIVINHNIGLTKEDLIHETAKAFGFNRIGNNITERIESVIDLLIKKKIIEIKDNKIIQLES